MSGVLDKKADKMNRREERVRKEQKEKRKVRIIAVTVVIVFALLVAGALFINSKFVRRTLTAITIGGVNFSAAEFDFFYNNSYSEYQEYMTSQLGDYATAYLPDSSRPHSSQLYNDETGETWADYFIDYTIDQIEGLVKFYNAAMASGYTMNDEKRAEMDNELMEYRMYAEMYGYPSLDAFIQEFVGISMNEKTLRNVIEFINTASSYSEHVRDSFVYSDGDIAEYYQENKDNLDSFTYRYFLVRAETVDEEDYFSDEEYEEANAAALAEAGAIAAQIVDGISDEEGFIAAAEEYSPEEYGDPDSTLKVYPGSWLAGPYQDWMLDEARQYGDVMSFEMTTGFYVVYFIERDPNEYRMAEMRQILIMREDISEEMFAEGVDDPDYIEAAEYADTAARERADTVVSLFIEGGATEEMLIALMAENSDDSTEGGFYDLITRNAANNKMVSEIEEWLFDPDRQIGDYELIETEAYGYHFVYFMGYGERYCDHLAKEGLQNRDYSAWEEGLEPLEAEKRWAFIFTQN